MSAEVGEAQEAVSNKSNSFWERFFRRRKPGSNELPAKIGHLLTALESTPLPEHGTIHTVTDTVRLLIESVVTNDPTKTFEQAVHVTNCGLNDAEYCYFVCALPIIQPQKRAYVRGDASIPERLRGWQVLMARIPSNTPLDTSGLKNTEKSLELLSHLLSRITMPAGSSLLEITTIGSNTGQKIDPKTFLIEEVKIVDKDVEGWLRESSSTPVQAIRLKKNRWTSRFANDLLERTVSPILARQQQFLPKRYGITIPLSKEDAEHMQKIIVTVMKHLQIK